MKKLKVVLEEGAFTPTRGTELAAGLDLYSPIDFDIPPAHVTRAGTAVQLGRYQIDTKVQVQIDKGYEGTVRGRSGLAFNSNIIGHLGTIDADFRGTVKVLLLNTGAQTVRVKRGERIGQLVISPVAMPVVEEVTSLTETERGEGGLGSTGK